MTDKDVQTITYSWLAELRASAWVGLNPGEITEMEKNCRGLVVTLKATQGTITDSLRSKLEVISHCGARFGLSPSAIAQMVFSLRAGLPNLLPLLSPEEHAEFLDGIAIFTFEVYGRTREQVIFQQKEDLLELSTPVISLWDCILAVPLIGTLDSRRAQEIMEKLLTSIVSTKAKVVILDITGVPTLDTLVANHIMKTAAASRLLGASLIITGISPVIAQTVVHLGIDLTGLTTRAVMADGVALAFDIINRQVVAKKSAVYEEK